MGLWPPGPCVPQALQMIKSVCMLNKLFPEKEKKFFRRQARQVKVRSYPKITLSCAFYLSPQVCKAFVKFRNFFFSSFFPPLSIEWQKLKNQTKNLSSWTWLILKKTTYFWTSWRFQDPDSGETMGWIFLILLTESYNQFRN